MSLSPSVPARILDATPILGPLSRAISKDTNLIFYVLVILLTGLVFTVKAWGLAALVIASLAVVPLMFAFYVAISWP